jgi:uncharacterized protein involved in type VI secretion and phage assembly
MTVDELMDVVAEQVIGRFYGKYEAVVTAVGDPAGIGRVRVKVPEVLGEDVETGWAFPCAPFGGGKDRGLLAIPEVGDTVWVEFAAGDISRPIWAGAFWGNPEAEGGQDNLSAEPGAETPTSEGKAAGPGHVVLRTKTGHRIALDDDGGLVIFANGGGNAEIRLKGDGEVVIKAARIKLCENAAQKLVLGDSFMQLFNAHTHPTGVGPSGPPATPMTPAQLSSKVTTE